MYEKKTIRISRATKWIVRSWACCQWKVLGFNNLIKKLSVTRCFHQDTSWFPTRLSFLIFIPFLLVPFQLILECCDVSHYSKIVGIFTVIPIATRNGTIVWWSNKNLLVNHITLLIKRNFLTNHCEKLKWIHIHKQ